jgi:hypothetical protein
VAEGVGGIYCCVGGELCCECPGLRRSPWLWRRRPDGGMIKVCLFSEEEIWS